MKMLIKAFYEIGRVLDEIYLTVGCYWIAKKMRSMQGADIHKLTAGERRVLRRLLNCGVIS